jgi:hypothetical protein
MSEPLLLPPEEAAKWKPSEIPWTASEAMLARVASIGDKAQRRGFHFLPSSIGEGVMSYRGGAESLPKSSCVFLGFSVAV